jgi:MarR family transcriptional regulator, organic hydroperoxide resistance regulator
LAVSATRGPSLTAAIEATVHRLLEKLGEELRDLGLTHGEINALAALETDSGRTVADLQKATGQRASTLTGVLDRLERRGLVERRPNPRDRRSFTVDLTVAGARAAKRVGAAFNALDRQALDAVSKRSAEGFLDVLNALDEMTRR